MDTDLSSITKATTYLAYSINMLLIIILVICICISFSSILLPSTPPQPHPYKMYKGSCEEFSPNFGQYNLDKQHSEFKHISLTAATDSQNSPSNLLTGSADRFIHYPNKAYKLNVKAYLPNLKGDVFSRDKSKMSEYALEDYNGNTLAFGLTTETYTEYKAYLYNKKEGSEIDLGKLDLASDKSYTLKLESDSPNVFTDYDHLIIGIVDKKNNKVVPLLYGKFY